MRFLAFDIYSCFPSAVQIACNEIGLSPLDARGVTVTGGLPCFGGPGNNYSLHAIAEMFTPTARAGRGTRAGHRQRHVPDQALAGPVFDRSAQRSRGSDADNRALQQQIDAAPRLAVAADPAGEATDRNLDRGFRPGGAQARHCDRAQ